MFHLSLLIMSHKILRFIISTSIILFVFSIIYWLLGTEHNFKFSNINSNSNSNSTNQKHLSYIDALYFTIGTHTTVGFGDITASSECVRSIVIIQLIILILQLASANL